MTRMHEIIHAAAARLPRVESAPSPLARGLAPRTRHAGTPRLRYTPSALPDRFHIA